jgi:hypothetical protein
MNIRTCLGLVSLGVAGEGDGNRGTSVDRQLGLKELRKLSALSALSTVEGLLGNTTEGQSESRHDGRRRVVVMGVVGVARELSCCVREVGRLHMTVASRVSRVHWPKALRQVSYDCKAVSHGRTIII